jgi:hypothetical protein
LLTISKITVTFAIFPESNSRKREFHSRLISMENISYGIMFSIFISLIKRVKLITLVWSIKLQHNIINLKNKWVSNGYLVDSLRSSTARPNCKKSAMKLVVKIKFLKRVNPKSIVWLNSSRRLQETIKNDWNVILIYNIIA